MRLWTRLSLESAAELRDAPAASTHFPSNSADRSGERQFAALTGTAKSDPFDLGARCGGQLIVSGHVANSTHFQFAASEPRTTFGRNLMDCSPIALPKERGHLQLFLF